MRTSLALILVALLSPVPAAADHGLLTWNFSGTVSSANDPGGFLSVMPGDPASGRVVWHTTMNQIFDVLTAAFYQEPSNGNIGVWLDVAGLAWAPLSAANITLQVHNDHTTFHDRFSTSDGAVSNNGGLTYAASGVAIVLQDDDATVFSSTSIPVVLPSLAELESATVSLTLTNINGTSNSATVFIDLIELTEEPHPAPGLTGGPLLILAGCLAVAGASRIRRRTELFHSQSSGSAPSTNRKLR